jgi:CheY-like chemotaxis protein
LCRTAAVILVRVTCFASASVLYIEDSPINARLMQRIFTRHFPELRLLVAVDGTSGLRMLSEEDPSLLLLDCHLPDMTGFDVLRTIRSSGNCVPVVAVTADAQKELAELMLGAGANGFITKPIDFCLLFEQVRLYAPTNLLAPQLAER